jgi:hypothetical protein
VARPPLQPFLFLFFSRHHPRGILNHTTLTILSSKYAESISRALFSVRFNIIIPTTNEEVLFYNETIV